MEPEYTNRILREKPPCKEQLLLDEMFETGCIATYATAATAENVRQSNDLFKVFSPTTFGAHFRKTKARLGEFLVTAKGIPGGVYPIVATSAANNSVGKIRELGLKYTPPPMKRVCSETSEALTEIMNPPYMTWKYTDHEIKTDFICVAITMFSGSKSVNFDIADDGLSVIIKFSWPNAMHNPDVLFAKAIKGRELSLHHPMVHALTSTLLESGITSNSKPEAKCVIPLPCKVRREVSSYSMKKIVSDTTNIVMLTFMAYQNDTIIKNANRSLSFD